MLKDIVGTGEEQLELPAPEPLHALFSRYVARFPQLGDFSASIVLACNRQFCDRGAVINDGDEIAFLPPVSGGTSRYTHQIEDASNFYGLTREPIDSAALARQILRGEDGAVVNFEGVVRNNTKGRATKFLDYECYEAMAIQTMAQIGRAIADSFAIGRIAMVHRLGRMEIGEASVVIVVTAPHRKPAFDAALEGINRLKRTVPIWKKEHFADGEVWVEGEWDDSVPRAAV